MPWELLKLIEEAEPSDSEEDGESDYVEGGDLEREEGRHRGRLEELKKMQEFKLYDVVPRLEALEKRWRVLKFLWVGKERREIWRCRYVVKDFRAVHSLGDVISSLQAVCQSRIRSWMLWQRVMDGLGWLRMRRMRSFMLQRMKTFVEGVSSRVQGSTVS